MWGLNGNGQLGLSLKDKVTVMATPQVVDIDDQPEVNVLQVACGSKHTIALLGKKCLIYHLVNEVVNLIS